MDLMTFKQKAGQLFQSFLAPFSQLRVKLSVFNVWRKDNKWKFRAGVSLIVITLSWFWLSPEPDTIKIYMNKPGITDLSKEKPVPDPLTLDFSDSAAPLQQINKQVTEGVSLSPETEGKWMWKSDKKLQFIPTEDWAVDESYSVSLDKNYFPQHVRLNTYSLSFDTADFGGEIIHSEFYQDPTQPKLKKMVVNVRFTHRVDQEDFRKRVELIMKPVDQRIKDDGKDFPFEISFNKVGNEVYIHSAQIDIPDKEQKLILKIDKGARSKQGGKNINNDLQTEVIVPGMYSYFRINSSQVSLVRNKHNEPEQVLMIETTDGVQEDTLEKGLEVYLLPKDKPVSRQNSKPIKNYSWSRAEEVGEDILKLSKRISLGHLPAEHEYAKLHSYRINVPHKRTLFIRLNKGVESVGGYILSKTYEQTTHVQAYPEELEIMGEGGVLSLSGNKKLPIVSRGNKGIYYEVAYVLPSQIQHLVSQTGGDFQNPYFSNYQFNEENITRVFDDFEQLPKVPPGKSQYTSFDFGAYLKKLPNSKRSGIFLFQMHGWDFDKRRRTGVTTKRLVMITDLGLLVKEHANKSRSVFVMSISSGRPVSGAKVEVLGKNGIPVHSASTDGQGQVVIPNLTQLSRSRSATAIQVTHGSDLSFIPYDRHDRRLDQSRFDIGGVRQNGESDALTAYLFSDRGIYRPGDTFHVGMIVKSAKWNRSLSDIPLQAVITDPRGLTIKETKFPLSAAGFEELSYTTRGSSPTGEYEIKLYLVKDEEDRSLLGSTSIKLEEFLPDRMKISATFSQERLMGWVHPDGLNAHVNLKNLYGTPATERRITANMTLSPYHPVFQKYSAYHFYDPQKADKGFTERLPETVTNNEGEADINLNLERFASASYNVSLHTSGYEAEGGRSVSTQRSMLVSPRSFLVGSKPDGQLSYVSKNSKRVVQFIA
ncbi:MAG: MG2 domain-containing protein, partial [Gammaproteobacteria bacterium]|nr:MG2 domain-containing protein [Gammaproteobacteria bacterium]